MFNREEIRHLMAAQVELPVERLTDQARLAEDLNLDSFERLTLHMAMEMECQAEFEPDDGVITTVGRMLDAIEAANARTALHSVPSAAVTPLRQA
jgi:acyl carrier protein